MPNIGLYDDEGRIRGAYIYLLLCRDGDGPVYVKVGMSTDPTKRLHSLRLGCPVTPRQFLTIRRPSSATALKVERALHSGLQRWVSSGEWYCVPIDEKPEFNAAIQSVLARHKQSGYPNKWEKVAVQPLVKEAAERKKTYQRHFARAPSRRDFLLAQR